MTYNKKLLSAKMLVSLGLCVFAFAPFISVFAANQTSFGQYGHLIALPIMLWAIWGKTLHGTGRAVRLMAFLGLAFTLGVYISPMPRAYMDTGQAQLIMGVDANLILVSVVFVLLLFGVFLSIGQGNDAN